MEMLHYTFMQRAVWAGIVVGIICPLIGIVLVLRRLSLIGDALAHVSLAGVAFGLVAGINPTAAGLVFQGSEHSVSNTYTGSTAGMPNCPWPSSSPPE